MMILAPLVSYLVSETLNISGLLSMLICAFILSLYGKKNLEKERSYLFTSSARALSYTSRSICDMFMGIGLALHFQHLAT
jgi:NhaP-type Na+/H+ or K+/H+ antiporter